MPQHRRLTALCTAAYFTSYLSRLNLAVVMVELIRCGFAPRETAALALTLCAMTYGAGQLLSGWLGERIRPQNIILLGFFITSAVNLSVAALPTATLLAPLWALNGFAQACMWPPIVAILSHHMSGAAYSRACVWVNWGSAFGTVFLYLFAPVLLHFGSFRTVFAMSGAAALVMAILWKSLYARYFGGEVFLRCAPKSESGESRPLPRLLLPLLLAIVLQGALRDGVTNWMPTFVFESFVLDSSSAILSDILLPIFQIPCTKLAAVLYQRCGENEAKAAALLFAAGTVTAALLSCAAGKNVLLTAVLMALLVGCMHGINFVLISLAPSRFRGYGRVSLVAGILNCSSYCGSALSTYGIAALSRVLPWQGTSLVWAGLAAIGATVSLALAPRWSTFRAEKTFDLH